MQEQLIRDSDPLAESEESSAIFAVVPELGNALVHKQTIAQSVASQDRLSPLPVATRRVSLGNWQWLPIEERASQTVPNVLDFKDDGRTRHSFNDGYAYILIDTVIATAQKFSLMVHIDDWNASSESEPIDIHDTGFKVWKVNETAFAFQGSGQLIVKYLAEIWGYQMVFEEPETFDTSLRFARSLETFSAVLGQSLLIQLPVAIGGTPPYTYALEGAALPSGLRYYPDDLQIRGTGASVSGLIWKVTDADGTTFTDDFSIVTVSTLSIGNIASTFSLPENSAPSDGTLTLPAASGGVPPYSYTFIGSTELYTDTDGHTAYITMSRSGTTVNITADETAIPQAGESLSLSATWRARDSVGQTAEATWSVSQDQYGG